MLNKVWDEIIYPFPNLNFIEVWKWISDFIPHFIMDVITYACWDYSYSTLLKVAPVGWDLLPMTDLLFRGNQLTSSRVKKGVISKSIASNQQGMCVICKEKYPF